MGKKVFTPEIDDAIVAQIKLCSNIDYNFDLLASKFNINKNTISGRWYKVLSTRPENKIFVTASKDEVLINRKYVRRDGKSSFAAYMLAKYGQEGLLKIAKGILK